MAANEPAMVSLIFSPAAAALDLAEAPLPPPNLHVFPIRHQHMLNAAFQSFYFGDNSWSYQIPAQKTELPGGYKCLL